MIKCCDQLPKEVMDEILPRLAHCVTDLIERLHRIHINIETTPIFFLNSTAHSIFVPCSGNGIPINMGFDAFMPGPIIRVHVTIDHGRRYYYRNFKKNQFPIRVLRRLIIEIKAAERKRQIQEKKQLQIAKANRAFEDLSQILNIPLTKPGVITGKNFRIRCLPNTPSNVLLMIIVEHPQAVQIIEKYKT